MTKKTLPKYKAPFSQSGSLQHYALQSFDRTEWRDNVPFEATMTIDSMRSGCSAKYTIWKDEQGRTYPMFVADIVELVRDARIENGTVKGKWVVRKRGQNYGLRFWE